MSNGRILVTMSLFAGLLACGGPRQVGRGVQPIENRDVDRLETDPGPLEAGPCDPLLAEVRPIELEPPLAVGRRSDGTIYVVDRVGTSDARSFRGRAGTLWRQSDATNGESSPSYLWYGASVGQTGLLVQLDREAWQRGAIARRDIVMALLDGDETGDRPSRLMPQGERLRLIDPRVVRGWSVVNRRSSIRAEYLARASDDRWLLVTMPNPLGFEHVRVFFGPTDAVLERRLGRFARQRDGGTTNISFDVDGEELEAYFPVRCGEPRSGSALGTRMDCPGELKAGSDVVILDRVLDAGALDRLSFVCVPQKESLEGRVSA